MPATFTWYRTSEVWTPPDPINGGTSVYAKPFLGGVSVQRLIVRFNAVAAASVYGANKFKVPALDVIHLQLVLNDGSGHQQTIAEEEIYSSPTVHVEDASNAALVQDFWGAFRPVGWDVALRRKNPAGSGLTAQVVLTIKATSNYGSGDSDHQALYKSGWLQFDVLFSSTGS